MAEFEVKLQVPESGRAELETAFEQAGGVTAPLTAIYFDTEEHDLRRSGVALRLRQEGETWVQTAKAGTASLLARLEHNVQREPAAEALPYIDMARHKGTAVGKHLERALAERGGWNAHLKPMFKVQVQRSAFVVTSSEGSVELAFDRGHIQADSQTQPICELELELKSGEPAEVLRLARHWCTTHGLWLNTISKAERGWRLVDAVPFGPPVLARQPNYKNSTASAKVASRVLTACLDHVLGNAAEIAAGSMNDDHIHQLRVGLRRLRTAIKDIKPLKSQVSPDWEASLVEVFRGLGQHRDESHVLAALEPRIEAAGGPVLGAVVAEQSSPQPADLVRTPQFQDALLGLLHLAHDALPAADNGQRRLKKAVRRRLDKLHTRTVADGKRFLELDTASQHQVRKQLKRLRYVSELVAPMFGAGKARAFVDKLKPAQEALGTYNDEVTALESFRAVAKQDQKALFAVGWLSARRDVDVVACARALRKLSKVRPYWR